MKVLLKKILIIVFLIPISCLKNLDSGLKQSQLLFLNNLTLSDFEFRNIPTNFNEGSSGYFSIKLKMQPADSLHIPVNISNSNFVQLGTNFITISPDHWNQWHTVYYNVAEDEYYEKSQNLTLSVGPAETSDSVFNGKLYSFDQKYINNDFNSVSYAISHPYEDSSNGSIAVYLTSKPRSNVTVNLNLEPNSDVSLSTTSVTFTPSNYNTAQIITLSYVSDILIEYDESFPLAISTSSSDPDYNNLQYQTHVLVYDNDIPNILFDTVFGMMEGMNTSVGMKLGAIPSSNVTVNLTTNDSSICTISGSTSFVFTDANYNSYQSFTVQAKPADNIDNLSDNSNCIITATASSSDPNYNNMVRTLVGSIYDAYNSGLYFPGFSFVDESGISNPTSPLKLTSEPTSSVKVCIKVSNYCEAFIESTGISSPDGSCTSIAGANTPYVIFDSTNWNTGFTIRLKGRHDWEYRPGVLSIPETGGYCTGPYPDDGQTISIRFHTQCSGCNSFEQSQYNSGTNSILGSYVWVMDDLDRWIYATPAHNGNFAGDSNLSGSNEIQKADYYCQLNQPSTLSGTFKAFLASLNRKCTNTTCTSAINWVLQPGKYYFQYENGQLAFKTHNTNPIFDFTFSDNQGFPGPAYWTGFDLGNQWQNTGSTDDCSDWSSDQSTASGNTGSPNINSYSAVSGGNDTCDQTKPIICIQQF